MREGRMRIAATYNARERNNAGTTRSIVRAICEMMLLKSDPGVRFFTVGELHRALSEEPKK